VSDQPYRVCIVVDPEFGERLAALTLGVPVWIVDTPANKLVAQRLWKERPQHDHLTGITTFHFRADASREEILIGELETIDLHHGSYSADPPYTQIEGFGTPLSDKIKAGLADYGFDEFSPTPTGFLAIRKVPPPDTSI